MGLVVPQLSWAVYFWLEVLLKQINPFLTRDVVINQGEVLVLDSTANLGKEWETGRERFRAMIQFPTDDIQGEAFVTIMDPDGIQRRYVPP